MNKIMTKEQIAEALELHAKWLRSEAGGTRANLTRANLYGANLTRANLYGANLYGANLTRANLTRANLDGAGLLWAECAWADHGECGRRLLAIVLLAREKTETLEARGQTITYMCGCFKGSEDELRAYIADGAESMKASRTIAVDFVSDRVAEMLAARAK